MERKLEVDALRGVAILAVVGLHGMSGWYDLTDGGTRLLWIGVNQALRFCVPLFVAVSGYLLMEKNQGKKIEASKFWKKRIVSLLPGFWWWSLFSVVVIGSVSGWGSQLAEYSWWQLLAGRADYHLYFVPMLMQLYLVFPILWWLIERWGYWILGSSLVGQGLVYWLFGKQEMLGRVGELVESDQQQYIYALSWGFYFVLGMVLARWGGKLKKAGVGRFFLVMVLGGWIWAVMAAIDRLEGGANVITATRFTRLPVLIMATGVISLALVWSQKWKAWQTGMKKFAWLGTYAYMIYLVHPLILRFIADIWRGRMDTIEEVMFGLGLGLGITGLVLVERRVWRKWDLRFLTKF